MKEKVLFEIIRDEHGDLIVRIAGIAAQAPGSAVTDQFWEILIQDIEKWEAIPEEDVPRYHEVRSIMIETLEGMKKRGQK